MPISIKYLLNIDNSLLKAGAAKFIADFEQVFEINVWKIGIIGAKLITAMKRML